MSLTQRLFSDALRDMQRAMAIFEQPLAYNGHRAVQNAINNSSFGRYPATDMVETPDTYELHAEVPGYDKKDIKIEMPDNHTLVLSGSTQKETTTGPATTDDNKKEETKDSKSKVNEGEQQALQKKDDQNQQVSQHSAPDWWVNERISGSFSRSFTFPAPIDQEKIKASYENGILKVVIPKTSKNQSRIISID
ncbi:MAG: HSP20-like chaperone [Benjaminiella poitrasii]|nr:MAG: HSP20-like chaperone [Benjaminiella poitrasii]